MALRTYQETMNNLFSRRKSEQYCLDLSDIRKLLADFNNPQNSYKTIHVAGTNGKGQVATKIAKGLEVSGYRVGLFTSPHITSFEERIQINGRMISSDEVLNYFERLVEKEPRLGFFELATLMAFLYFREEMVDIAVIEAGIGGEFDTTNMFTPILSVITSIGFDHCDVLGKTLNEIASHKAGIIKKQVPVILGPNIKQEAIFNKAKRLSAPLKQAKYSGTSYIEENNATARLALKTLNIGEEIIEKAMGATPPCRFEQRGQFIFDMAHNPSAFKQLKEALLSEFSDHKFLFVLGMAKTKNIKECLLSIEPIISEITFIDDGSSEAMKAEALGKLFATISAAPFSVNQCLECCMRKIARQMKGNVICVVCGSAYIMHRAKRAIC